MKKTVTILILIISLSAFTQTRLSVSAGLDGKLAFFGDDKGNKAFTYNGNYRFMLEGNQQKIGFWYTGLGYESANLKGGNYERYYFFIGYNLNDMRIGQFLNKLNINFIDFRALDYLEASADFTYGLTRRFGAGFTTRGLSFELSYPITKKIDVFIRNQWVQRPDIDHNPEITGKNYNGVVRMSNFVGVRIDFYNLIGKLL